mmetsp:Transcript_6601/g.9993  ORF Transcript_6601/g.9993 Transcript_6601/m.9993 type:complete len:255 (-) Transcript_6601:1127-1891(-)
MIIIASFEDRSYPGSLLCGYMLRALPCVVAYAVEVYLRYRLSNYIVRNFVYCFALFSDAQLTHSSPCRCLLRIILATPLPIPADAFPTRFASGLCPKYPMQVPVSHRIRPPKCKWRKSEIITVPSANCVRSGTDPSQVELMHEMSRPNMLILNWTVSRPMLSPSFLATQYKAMCMRCVSFSCSSSVLTTRLLLLLLLPPSSESLTGFNKETFVLDLPVSDLLASSAKLGDVAKLPSRLFSKSLVSSFGTFSGNL